MKKAKSHIDYLIGRKVEGTITVSEMKHLNNWIAESEKNAITYKSLIEGLSHNYIQSKKEDIWNKVNNKIENKERIINTKRRLVIGKVWRVAAILIVLLVLPVVLSKYGGSNFGDGFGHTVKGNDITTRFYLPDGSLVVLARGSEIYYTNDYSINNRELKLKGKAYIEVSDNSNSLPLVVQTGSSYAIVNNGMVSIESSDSGLNVAVAKGEVEVVDTLRVPKSVPVTRLTPATMTGKMSIRVIKNDIKEGQLLSISANKVIVKREFDDKCEQFSWKDRVFCFNDLEVRDLIKKMSEWYGKDVEIVGETDNVSVFSGSYNNPSLEYLVQRVFGNNLKNIQVKNNKVTIVCSR